MKHVFYKFIRYLYHRQAGRTVFTELILKNGKRPDLIVLEQDFVWIEEICISEKESSIIEKKKDYPFPIKVIKITDLNVKEIIKQIQGD
jgi:hypothetical protein